MNNSDKKFIFGIIFVVGLLLCLFSNDVSVNTPIDDANALAFSILISIFGGCGLLIAIFKQR